MEYLGREALLLVLFAACVRIEGNIDFLHDENFTVNLFEKELLNTFSMGGVTRFNY